MAGLEPDGIVFFSYDDMNAKMLEVDR
jgi:hypothetical protein